MKTRAKICGVTTPEHALAASKAGADAIGLVFYDPSPRSLDIARAAEITCRVPAFVSVVGLFVNPEASWVREVLARVPLDLLQFHGDEEAAFCGQFGRRWIKAVRVRRREDIEAAFRTYHNASGLLVDAYDPNLFGGTGNGFDWALIPEQRPLPVILAGGLTPANVGRAIEQVRPWAVDVSGGVEHEGPLATKGFKDVSRINEFMREVQRVN